MKSDRAYLLHMMECIRRIEGNTRHKDAFFADSTLQDAVLRNLQTMAEASQRLSDGLKAAHPAVEWRRMAAFRNVLVHNYLGIDLEEVWRVIEEQIQHLKTEVERMLRDPGADT